MTTPVAVSIVPAVLALITVSVPSEIVKAKIPGQPIEVSIDIPGFNADPDGGIPGRTLLIGKMKDGATISLLQEQNFPYVAAADCPKVYSKETGFKTFVVDGKACSQFRVTVHDAVSISQFYANLATPDVLYTIHVSQSSPLRGSGAPKEIRRSDVEPIVKSLTVTGEADRSAYIYPVEVYAFRDEAAKAEASQLDWVEKQCSARADEWAPHFYLGELAVNLRKDEPADRGYVRASELLAAKEPRSVKETRALLVSLDTHGGFLAMKKRFDAALPVCQRILEIVKPQDPPELRGFGDEARFNLACCYAMMSKPVEALDALRKAIQAKPEFKKRAASEEFLASLRTKPEFKALVGP